MMALLTCSFFIIIWVLGGLFSLASLMYARYMKRTGWRPSGEVTDADVDQLIDACWHLLKFTGSMVGVTMVLWIIVYVGAIE